MVQRRAVDALPRKVTPMPRRPPQLPKPNFHGTRPPRFTASASDGTLSPTGAQVNATVLKEWPALNFGSPLSRSWCLNRPFVPSHSHSRSGGRFPGN